jgi:hypothetical protein
MPHQMKNKNIKKRLIKFMEARTTQKYVIVSARGIVQYNKTPLASGV